MSDNARTFIQGYEVELPSIEKELVKFWKNVAGEDSETAVIRATTLNFIDLTTSAAEYQQAAQLVAGIAQHHPSRMILAHIEMESSEEKITSHVNAYCQPPQHGGKQICCEHISLLTGKKGIAHLPGAILPLLLPDLPVFLFCPQPKVIAGDKFVSLLHLVSRVILDTPLECRTMAEASDKAQLVLRLHSQARLSDLAWGRLTIWREALAQYFDGHPQTMIRNLHQVQINSAGMASGFSAVLLLFWLASRLGWQFLEANSETNQLTFNSQDHVAIKAILGSSESGDDAGTLVSVSLTFKEPEGDQSFRSYLEGNRLVTESNSAGEWQKLNIFDNIKTTREKLVCDELDYLEEDTIYLETIKTIASMKKEN